MQTHGGAEAEAAITSAERTLLARVLVDWGQDGEYDHPISDMSPFVESAVTDRSLRGSAPEDVLLIEGAAAAEFSGTLSGEYLGMPLTRVFSPYQPDSPFWGKDIVGAEISYEIGVSTALGIVWYPQFIGHVRSVTPDRSSGYVQLTALDRAELLRRPVSFPAWAMYDYQRSVLGRIANQLIDTQWVVDHCLRTSGVSPTPLRPPTREENGLEETDPTGPQLWIPGTGGYLPTIGWLDNWTFLEFPADDGPAMYEQEGAGHPDSPDPSIRPECLAALGDSTDEHLRYWALNRDQINPLGIQVMGFTLVTRGTNSTYYQTAPTTTIFDVYPGDGTFISIKIGDSGQLWTEFFRETDGATRTSAKLTIPTTGDFQHVSVMWDVYNSAGPQVWLSVGNVTSGASWSTAGLPVDHVSDVQLLKGLARVNHNVALNDIFWTATNFTGFSVDFMSAWTGQEAEYVAVLDKGTNRLSYLPSRSAEDAWELISEAVGAEFGAAFWDESGVFHFWNRDTIATKRSDVVRDVYLDNITDLGITNSLDSVRNIWSMVANQQITYDTTTISAQSVDQFYVPAGTRRNFRIWSDRVVCMNPGMVPMYTGDTWDDTIVHGYVFQRFLGGTWQETVTGSGVDISASYNNLGEIVVSIWNGWGEPIRLATDEGEPALRIGGSLMVGGDAQAISVRDITSVNKYRGRNMTLTGDWYQEFSNIDGMLDDLLLRTLKPVPTTDDITIAGDPRIQLGDTIRVHDPEGLGDRFDLQVYGIQRSFSRDDGLVDRYAVELARVPGGIWDDAEYGVWDDSTFIWG